MKRFLVVLMLVFCKMANAEESAQELDAISVNNMYQESFQFDGTVLPDHLGRIKRVERCIDAYIDRQERSYARAAQGNLYDLLQNFDRILSRVNGTKLSSADISHKEKITTLAKIQCNAYYEMGMLKD